MHRPLPSSLFLQWQRVTSGLDFMPGFPKNPSLLLHEASSYCSCRRKAVCKALICVCFVVHLLKLNPTTTCHLVSGCLMFAQARGGRISRGQLGSDINVAPSHCSVSSWGNWEGLIGSMTTTRGEFANGSHFNKDSTHGPVSSSVN